MMRFPGRLSQHRLICTVIISTFRTLGCMALNGVTRHALSVVLRPMNITKFILFENWKIPKVYPCRIAHALCVCVARQIFGR